MLKLEHVAKIYTYTKIKAVKDFYFGVKNTAFIILVGPSDDGDASTAFPMIAGLDTITNRELTMAGICMNDVVSKDKVICYAMLKLLILSRHDCILITWVLDLKVRK